MSIGTVYNRNFLHRMGDAWAAFKALPSPAQLYPPQQQAGGPYWLTWQGWQKEDARAGALDQQRAKTAVTSPWVFADIAAIANEFSAAELIVKERIADGLEDVDNHALELLWEAPNPHMGRSFLMKFWAWSYTLVGKSYLYWLPAGGTVREVWPIPPFMIRPVPDDKNFIGGYAFRASEESKPILIPSEYITYSHSVNPFDIRDGMSFLVAAMTGIESDLAMEAWNRNFFSEQNGVPDGMITINKDTLDTDLLRIREEIRTFFGGTRRGVAVARAGDMDYKPFGRSQKEVEFKEGIELASKIIGRTLGFPDGYWSETANRANAEQARATMIAGAVWPLLVSLAEDLNAGAVKRFWGEQYRAEFKDIRPEDRQIKLAELQFYAQIETVNELRKRIGSDDLPDPRGGMFVAEIAKGTPIPATPSSEQTEEYIQAQEDEVAALEGDEEPAPVPGEEPAAIEGDMEETDAPFQKAADLANWERKALKALKRFHAADVRFTSEAIPEAEQQRIHAALQAAETAADVRAAFKAEEDSDVLIDAEWAGALEWAKRVANNDD